jgi:hypothetical protein
MLFTSEWWISVVVAGPVVGVLASYVVRWLDLGTSKGEIRPCDCPAVTPQRP